MIREYVSADKDALLGVWSDSVRVAHPFWPPERFAHERRAVAEKFLAIAETYVYDQAGTVLGFISMLDQEVGGLFVAPSVHRQGIGRALIEHVRASRGHLELEVFEANVVGRAFYERCGFVMVGDRVEDGSALRVLRLRLPSNTRMNGPSANDG